MNLKYYKINKHTAFPKETVEVSKIRRFPSSLLAHPPSPSTSSLSLISTPLTRPLLPLRYGTFEGEKKRNKKKLFPGPDEISKVDKEDCQNGLSSHVRACLGLLLKMCTVHGKSVEDSRNFPNGPAG